MVLGILVVIAIVISFLVFVKRGYFSSLPISHDNAKRAEHFELPKELTSKPWVPPAARELNKPDKPEEKTKLQVSSSITKPDYQWNISVSFGKSSSKNFERALYLAKASPNYFEQHEGNADVYQATYSSKPDEYRQFIKLYELVSTWKSAHVMICGELIDRKIVGQINYCYGDKCRSGNPDFCYGASVLTTNPFGCHRIQISSNNHPWASFFHELSDGNYILDKQTMRKRIDSFAAIYRYCPDFDYEKILQVLHELPSILSSAEYHELLDRISAPNRIEVEFVVKME